MAKIKCHSFRRQNNGEQPLAAVPLDSSEVGKGGAFHEQDGVEVTCLHQSSSFLLAIPSFVSSDRGGLILHGFQPRNGRRQRRALLLCKSGMCGECCATGHCSSLIEATSCKHQSSWSKRLTLYKRQEWGLHKERASSQTVE